MQYKKKIMENLYKVSSPERYTGNEWNTINKEWQAEKLKIAFAFPDVYEIGMSHLGLKILYHLINNEENMLAERVYAPWQDMEDLLKEKEIPLYTLESYHEIKDFDILGFTLQYEMSYTNILNMLDLSGMSIYSKERNEDDPLVIAGGATVFNPEPIADFIDLFFIGEAEGIIIELLNKYQRLKSKGMLKKDVLLKLSKIDGVYVPSLYSEIYGEQGEILALNSQNGVKARTKKQLVQNLDQAFYPTDFIVPYRDTVHERVVLEISRGCTRSCRFCAAGMTYRPSRERSVERLMELAEKALKSTGYDEISLTSLSAMDYTKIEELLKRMTEKFSQHKISVSLSSLRVDEFSVELAKEVQKVRKTGLTFAPEAGTQRLRNVINKNINEEDLYNAVRSAFENGWSRIKLYFMIGLPTETMDDIAGIVELAKKVRDIGREVRKNTKKRMRNIQISVSVSTFVPKTFTPFQWVKMDDVQTIIKKHDYLRNNLRGHGLNFSWNDPELSRLEGVIARGDRRLSEVIASAWEKGSRFEGWNECFDARIWGEAFRENKIAPAEYLRERKISEIFSWEKIDVGVSKEFLLKEYQKSEDGDLTTDCRFEECTGCAICADFGVDLELVGGKR
ncbi:TIGR03960 family B12-binding radical SAM protein [Halanaerobium hydrogeniformans]|uniref:Radical SAM domain protein n=1 Tax=Halanaerobium hydrogeniformans TaxID=656519 RepID=E4RMN5_HALHG|nr:TIGR03960 family B12-binding radical SAM protein [Halanaerobium hydrogeniformans]ADQ14566.1 Radical SAM domain protein [Halanaerobium hydrogeniformans]